MAKGTTTLVSEGRKAEYKATYDRLMARACGRSYESGTHERHHIFPKSLGGSNEKSNIVCLTYREHFLAHWLLTKFTEGKDQRKMFHALFQITGNNGKHLAREISSWQFALSRKAQSMARKGSSRGPMPEDLKIKISLARKGKPGGNKGKPGWTKGKPAWNKGISTGPESEETKRKKSLAKKGRPSNTTGKKRSAQAIAKCIATFERKRRERISLQGTSP